MRGCLTQFQLLRDLMAFGLFRKRVPEAAVPAVEPKVPATAAVADAAASAESDSAKEILELLELELGAMIRQLERAAGSVASGAEATAGALPHHPPSNTPSH